MSERRRPTLGELEGELADCLNRLERRDRAQARHLMAAAAAAAACYWAVAEGASVDELLLSARGHCSDSEALKAVACGVAPLKSADSARDPLATGRAAAAAFREQAFFAQADADALLRHFVWLMARFSSLLGVDAAFDRVERQVAAWA